MSIDELLIDLLHTKPEFLLSALMVVVLPIAMLPAVWLKRHSPRALKTELVRELLANPAVQERLKDPAVNLEEFVGQIVNSSSLGGGQTVGLLTKINRDITWDVSGLIGVIVTVVLMIMVVSRSYGDMPREIVAGWTTILGFYFGKATK